MFRRRVILFSLTIVAVAGCSSDAPLETPPTAASLPAADAAPAPSPGSEVVLDSNSETKGKPEGEASAANTDNSALAAFTPSTDMSDLFAPPKLLESTIPAPVEPLPLVAPPTDPVKPIRELPPLRLIGFVDVEGQKALLAINGKVNVVSAGETNSGLDILRIEPPLLALRAVEGGDEIQLNLFEQPWSQQPAPLPGGAKPSGRPAPGRTTPRPGNVGGSKAALPGLEPALPTTFPAFPPAPAAPPAVPPLSSPATRGA